MHTNASNFRWCQQARARAACIVWLVSTADSRSARLRTLQTASNSPHSIVPTHAAVIDVCRFSKDINMVYPSMEGYMSVSCLACLPLYKRTLLVGVHYTTWVYACLQGSQFTNAHCKKYLFKMTTSAWLLQFQGSLNIWMVWLKEFQNTIGIHQPPHNSIKLQRASTDACQQYKIIAIIQFRTG